MPFHASNHKASHSIGEGLFAAGASSGSIGLGSNLQRLASGTTSAGTDTLRDSNSSSFPSFQSEDNDNVNMAQSGRADGRGLLVGNTNNDSQPPTSLSAPGSTLPTEPQPYQSPRRQPHERIPSLQNYLPPQPQYKESPYSATSSQSLQSFGSGILPSNASSGGGGLPGALQPAGGSRPPVSTAYTAPTTIPTMQSQPLQNNASQYSQPPSRTNTLHSHSRSSPSVGTLDGASKYIPFNQTPTQTPTTSNPKAYNLSNAQTPQQGAGPSHSPLNLTDIRSRAISDANEGPQGTAFFSYSDQPTNSNYLAPFLRMLSTGASGRCRAVELAR